VKYTDPDGKALETPWDFASAIFGVISTTLSFANKDYLGGIIGGLGTIADGVSALIPGLPGGWSVGIKAIQYGSTAFSAIGNMAEGILKKDGLKLGIGVMQSIGMALGPAGSKYLKYAEDAYERASKIPSSMVVGMIYSGIKDEHVGVFLKAMEKLGVNADTIKESYAAFQKYILGDEN
jgi:hypothetical protein